MENIKIHRLRGYQKQSIYSGNAADTTLKTESNTQKCFNKWSLVILFSHIQSHFLIELAVLSLTTHTYIHMLKTHKRSEIHLSESHVFSMSRVSLSAVLLQRGGGSGQRNSGDWLSCSRCQSNRVNRLADAVQLHPCHFLLLTLCHKVVELCSAVANQSSQVTHKLVDKTFALHFADHVSVIIVPEEKQESAMK